MGGVEIGPLIFSAPRFAVVVGIAVYLVATGIIARRLGETFRAWATLLLLAAILGARAGFVILHWDVYIADPLSILAFWQGGFSWPFGAAAALAVGLVQLLRQPRQVSFLVIAAGFALAAWNVAFQLTAEMAATPLPEQSFTTFAGQSLSLDDRDGRPLVLNLWATWCPPCRREMPMMAEVASELDGVDMIFANQGEGPRQIRDFLTGAELTLPLAVTDPGHALMAHYDIQGLPATLFIRADGTLQYLHLGEISRAQLLSETDQLKGNAE